MMSLAPPIIAIDDERDHLDGLTEVLKHFETPYLPFHFTGERAQIQECPRVRLIFVDLHLLGGPPGDHTKDFSVIGGLIEKQIRPSGPYLILLWTKYPDEAPALRAFLNRLEGVTKPIDVLPLAKTEYLDEEGRVTDMEALVGAIRSLTKGWLKKDRLAGLRGAWSPLEDREAEALVEQIYEARSDDMGRVVELED